MFNTIKKLIRPILRIMGFYHFLGKIGYYHLYTLRRKWLAKKYIKGVGLEIGALHYPLSVPRGAKVKYVDVVSKKTSIEKFPELNPDEIVDVDYIADGFKLDGVEDNHFDFLIANHVLEHSPNPIGTLKVWLSKLKTKGILYFAVPEVNHCFDKGRRVTTVEHLKDDYEFYDNIGDNPIADHDLEHYIEWVSISAPRILNKTFSEKEKEENIKDLNDNNSEIHFHTFTRESIKSVLEYFQDKTSTPFKILETRETRGGEVICICEKL